MNDLVIPEIPDASLTGGVGAALATVLARGRAAQAGWARVAVAERLAVVRRARLLMAREAEALAGTVARAVADTLVAEVLPLLEAARWLEGHAAGLLAAQAAPGRRPLWLWGVRSRVERAPLGVVLVLAPGNYPLFLAGTQALQALVAGNAVAWKPAPGGEAAALAVADALRRAGLPEELLAVLGVQDGPAAVAAGFDRVVLTGSAETGRRVMAAAAETLTPVTMELSGSDAVFVLPGADVSLVARCLAYGLRLNAGATCIAPRRVFVGADGAVALERALVALLPGVPDAAVPPGVAARLEALVLEAQAAGARVVGALPRPMVVSGARGAMRLLREDVFAPWLALVAVADMEAALAEEALCPFALGASVFGPAAAARVFAGRVRGGAVCINDLIVPTADPRVPFGGGGHSGFGRTRGAEGLLEMTAARAVMERAGRFRPHLAAPKPADAGRFLQMVRVLHWR